MSLLPSKEEVQLLSTWVEESLGLFGLNATLYSREEMSMYLDSVSLGPGVSVKVLLQENPRKKLLENLGWYQEFKDTESTLVYLPYSVGGSLFPLKEKDVLLFEDRMSLMVSSINRDYLYGLWYITQCVPFVQDNKELGRNAIGTQSKFLRSDREEVY